MTVELTKAIWAKSQQRGGALLLLLALASYASLQGAVCPKLTALARRARMSRRHIGSLLRLLVEGGKIEMDPLPLDRRRRCRLVAFVSERGGLQPVGSASSRSAGSPDALPDDPLRADSGGQRRQLRTERRQQGRPGRLQQQRHAQRQRLEQQRLGQQRVEQQRLEQQRLGQQRVEQQRLGQQRLERRRLERRRLGQQRLGQQRLGQRRLGQRRLERRRPERQRLGRRPGRTSSGWPAGGAATSSSTDKPTSNGSNPGGSSLEEGKSDSATLTPREWGAGKPTASYRRY